MSDSLSDSTIRIFELAPVSIASEFPSGIITVPVLCCSQEVYYELLLQDTNEEMYTVQGIFKTYEVKSHILAYDGI